jgi:hypothetical protein
MAATVAVDIPRLVMVAVVVVVVVTGDWQRLAADVNNQRNSPATVWEKASAVITIDGSADGLCWRLPLRQPRRDWQRFIVRAAEDAGIVRARLTHRRRNSRAWGGERVVFWVHGSGEGLTSDRAR